MQDIIKKIYESGIVVDKEGKEHKLQAEIDSTEGHFLSDIINQDPKIVNTLEIGFAYGLSSLHICQAIKDREGAFHTVIDSFQHEHWHDNFFSLNFNAICIWVVGTAAFCYLQSS